MKKKEEEEEKGKRKKRRRLRRIGRTFVETRLQVSNRKTFIHMFREFNRTKRLAPVRE